MDANWINNLPTAPTKTTSPPARKIQHLFKVLKGGGPSDTSALVASVVISIIAAFFILVLLRPPISTRTEHAHETPKLDMSKVVVWSLVAGTTTLFLSLVL